MLRLGVVCHHGFGKAPALEEGQALVADQVLVGVQIMEADLVAAGQVMEADQVPVGDQAMEADPAVEVQAAIPDS
jgi:hypothetical protein